MPGLASNPQGVVEPGTLPSGDALQNLDAFMTENNFSDLAVNALSDLRRTREVIVEVAAEHEIDASRILAHCDELSMYIIRTEMSGVKKYNVPKVIKGELNAVEMFLYATDTTGGAYAAHAGQTARAATTTNFKPDDRGNGPGGNVGDNADAFRHSYWHALLTISSGEECSKLWGDAHEFGTAKNFSSLGRFTESLMDLTNNAAGRQLGLELMQSGSDVIADSLLQGILGTGSVSQAVKDWVSDGKMVQMDGNTLIPSTPGGGWQ